MNSISIQVALAMLPAMRGQIGLIELGSDLKILN